MLAVALAIVFGIVGLVVGGFVGSYVLGWVSQDWRDTHAAGYRRFAAFWSIAGGCLGVWVGIALAHH